MKVAVCLIVKNEQDSISEWISYHIVLGFDTIIVFDNGSTDLTMQVLKKFAGFCDLRVIQWDKVEPSYQIDSYNEALLRYGSEFEWMAFIDSDEFVVLHQHDTVQEFLFSHSKSAAIAINWAIFGSSGHISTPSGLVIENFRSRSEVEFGPNQHVKMFIRPDKTIKCVNPHYFEISGDYVSPAGAPVHWISPGVTTHPARHDLAQINHYFIKSTEQWEQKMRRGYHDTVREQEIFVAYDRNEVEDLTITRLSEQTKKLIERVEQGSFSAPDEQI